MTGNVAGATAPAVPRNTAGPRGRIAGIATARPRDQHQDLIVTTSKIVRYALEHEITSEVTWPVVRAERRGGELTAPPAQEHVGWKTYRGWMTSQAGSPTATMLRGS
jgi:hypothetical protein